MVSESALDDTEALLTREVSVFAVLHVLGILHTHAVSSSGFALWVNLAYRSVVESVNVGTDSSSVNWNVSQKAKGPVVDRESFRKFVLSISRRQVSVTAIDEAFDEALECEGGAVQMRFGSFLLAMKELLRSNAV